MAGHAVSEKLLHLVDDNEPEWGEGGGEDYLADGDEEEEEEVRVSFGAPTKLSRECPV